MRSQDFVRILRFSQYFTIKKGRVCFKLHRYTRLRPMQRIPYIPFMGTSVLCAREKRKEMETMQCAFSSIGTAQSALCGPAYEIPICSMCFLRNSTLTQFKDAHEMLDSWMSDQGTLKLSDYGTRRLFDALKRCMWAKSQKSLANLSFLKETEPGPDLIFCCRCTKSHKGGPDACKSRDRVCTTNQRQKNRFLSWLNFVAFFFCP